MVKEQSLAKWSVLLLSLLLCGCRVFVWSYRGESPPPISSRAATALELRSAGKYSEAIEEYLAHIEARRSAPHRPPDENPSFYYLLIGDTYLEANCPVRAEEAYDRASADGVEVGLVIDRFRRLSHWYGEKGCFERGIAVLRKIRDRDPLLVDPDIDALHKQMIGREDNGSPS